jgi:hypothetical protein
MKFLIVQLPPFSRHLIPLRSKYSSQNPVLEHPQSMVTVVTLHRTWRQQMKEQRFWTLTRPMFSQKHSIPETCFRFRLQVE